MEQLPGQLPASSKRRRSVKAEQPAAEAAQGGASNKRKRGSLSQEQRNSAVSVLEVRSHYLLSTLATQ